MNIIGQREHREYKIGSTPINDIISRKNGIFQYYI